MLQGVRRRLCERVPAVLSPQRGLQRNDARRPSLAVSTASLQPTCAMLEAQTWLSMRNTVRAFPPRPDKICAHKSRF